MSATAGQPARNARHRETTPRPQPGQRELAQLEQAVKPAVGFWTKVNNDWVFNLAGLLAYNLLMSIFPILLVLLAIAGLILGQLSPGSTAHLQASISAAVPGGAQFIEAAASQLARNAGVLLVIGIVAALFTGSRLFITMENCFGIIFRVRSRTVVRQNLMAFGMLLVFAVLVPIISLGSVVPTAIERAINSQADNAVQAFVTQAIGVVASVVVAAIFFALIYVVVPNRPVRLGEVWRGTLVAAVLLALYELLFPLYEAEVLHPQNFGSVAGFAIVILLFFYYVGFILLVGAEINSWAIGQRQTAGDIPALLNAVQAQATAPGAAGPTAGAPHEGRDSGVAAPTSPRTPESAGLHEREPRDDAVQPPAEAEWPGDAAPG
jgi:YihY family inner membrane protein